MNKVWILWGKKTRYNDTFGHVAFWHFRENDPSTKSSLLHFTKSGCTAVLMLWKPNSAWKKNEKVIDSYYHYFIAHNYCTTFSEFVLQFS